MNRISVSIFPLLILAASSVIAHPGHSHRKTETNEIEPQAAPNDHTWSLGSDSIRELGSFVMAREGTVQIRRADDSLVTLPIEMLADEDQEWIEHRMNVIRRAVEAGARIELQLAQLGENEKGLNVNKNPAPEIARAFDPFVKLNAIRTRWDNRFFYVESNGIPNHPMMIGITAWQQQVPLPQKYVGDNAWQIPLNPVPAKNPQSAKGNFLRGAIAIAANGIPIFNPLNNRGDDAYLFGELDEYGGHCGRADDYHYHIAPVHLEKTIGKGLPIAYALDGYPIYGYEEPDGSPVKGLDSFNGHKDANGNYHYHATKKYPYLNGGFHGEVVERGGQVDPQPRAEPLRPALPPLRDAKITDFKETKPGGYLLTYDVKGKTGTVGYTLSSDGSANFVFTDIRGKTTSETYSARRREPGGRNRQPPPPPPRNDDNPPPRDDQRPPRGGNSPMPYAGREKPKSDHSQLAVSSSSLDSKGFISVDCTCDGASQSPAIEWKDPPKGTKSFAVSLWHIAPDQEKSYWLVYNIPADVTKIEQNAKPVGQLGLNDRRRPQYDPMCSKGPGVKEYHITVFALSAEPKLAPDKASRAALLEAIKDLILAEGTVDFKYERKK